MKTFIEYATTACAVATLATPAWSETARYDDPVNIDLTFVYHIDADMAEQDVFVVREAGATEVFRATAADRDMGQPLYASAQPQAHSPFDIEALGPYPKGAAIDMTLGEWFGASGSGSYSCEDGAAEIDVAFDGLVPEGVYTMWHFFMAMPPTDPFIGTYDLPLGSRDGSDSVFTADADGTARFQRSFKPCLQLGGEHLMSGLAIAWHSDGQTYGVKPGEFGLNSHIQLFLGLPPRAGM
ncbi:hypothetical protein [Halomonas sp. M20]|uniref:hypothetical protein n=1 Tax=Halomonas sp. M20 TaxID=2763264 RepID=UPI001D0A3046|nr:hypothetical protein [Halomonas sp. M20]